VSLLLAGIYNVSSKLTNTLNWEGRGLVSNGIGVEIKAAQLACSNPNPLIIVCTTIRYGKCGCCVSSHIKVL
jgi:hypothetical protein